VSAGFLARGGAIGVGALAVSFGYGPAQNSGAPTAGDLLGLTMLGTVPGFDTASDVPGFSSLDPNQNWFDTWGRE
jgi:hypothetical protein